MSEQVGYAVVMAQNLGEARTVSFQFNFMQGADAAEMSAELDKLASVMDRQVARAELPSRRKELSQQKLIAEIITKDIADMRAKAAAPPDPQKRNQTNVTQLHQNVEAQMGALNKTQRSIEELEKIIAELEKKAA